MFMANFNIKDYNQEVQDFYAHVSDILGSVSNPSSDVKEKPSLEKYTKVIQLGDAYLYGIKGQVGFNRDNISTETKSIIQSIILVMHDTTLSDIPKELPEILTKKNIDYGNSFDKNVNEWGVAGIGIRISDKLLRIKSLLGTASGLVEDESIIDTYTDLLGYLTLTANYVDYSMKA